MNSWLEKIIITIGVATATAIGGMTISNKVDVAVMQENIKEIRKAQDEILRLLKRP